MVKKRTKKNLINEIKRIRENQNITRRRRFTNKTTKPDLNVIYNELIAEYPSESGAFDVSLNGRMATMEQHAAERKVSQRTIKKRIKEDGYIISSDKKVIRANVYNLPLLTEEFKITANEARRMVRELSAPEDMKRVKTLENTAVLMDFMVNVQFMDGHNGVLKTMDIRDQREITPDFFQDTKRMITDRKSYIKLLISDYMNGQFTIDMLNDPQYTAEIKFTVSEIRSGNQPLTLDMKDMIIRDNNNLTVYNKGIKSFESPPEFTQTFTSLYNQFNNKEQERKIKAQARRREKRQEQGLNVDSKIRELKKAPELNADDIDYLELAECMAQYLLLNYYQFITPAYLRPYGDLTAAKLLLICQDKHINYRALDVEGNIINAHYEEKPNRKNKKTLYIVLYNNHIYTIKDLKLFKKNKPLIYDNLDKVEYIKDDTKTQALNQKLYEFLNRNILPQLLFIGSFLKAIIYDDITYTNNKDYKISFEILKCKGLQNYYEPIKSAESAISLLLKHYKPADVEIIDNKPHKINNICYSYAPQYMDIKAQQYYYSSPHFQNSDENDNTESIIKGLNNSEIINMDMNKAFSTMLSKLPFLPGHDTTKHKVYKYTGEPLIPHYSYNVYVYHKNILCPRSFPYLGYVLIKWMECGFKNFKIVEVLENTKTPNYYTEIINNLYDTYGPDAKYAINCHIGKMASYRKGNKQETLEFIKLCTEDEADRYKGPGNEDYIIKRDQAFNGYVMVFKLLENHKVRIKNNIVLNLFIKDMVRIEIFNKMIELKIPETDILQIKVDSLMFIKNKINFKDIKDIGPNLGQWKYEPVKKLQSFVSNHDIKYKFYTNLLYDNLDPKTPIFNPQGGYYDGYAGAGKSHFIRNVLIPNVEGDYMILTPQHSINASYLKMDPVTKKSYNSEIIHYYLYNPKLEIKETHIIVDEIGLFGDACLKVLMRLKLQGHIIHMFGDYRQCLPVNSKGITNNQYIISALATEGRPSAEHKRNKTNYYFMASNYRNNYTKEEYDHMINTTDKKELKQMIIKHNTETRERCQKLNIIITDYIVYYTTDKRDEDGKLILSSLNKINNKVMKALNINIYTPGCRVVCKTNTLRTHKDYKDLNTDSKGHNLPFYNNQDFKVSYISYNKDYPEIMDGLILTDGVHNYKVYISDYNQYFRPYYAKSIYNVQGESLDNYIISEEPADLETFISDPRAVYTLLSRQRTPQTIGKY